MHRGYVKLWRKAEDSGLMRDHKTWAVWSWILIHAAHKPRSVVVGRSAVDLLPGQLVFGRKSLSDALGLTEQNVRSCLKLLETLGNITIKPTNKFSVLTVINWELYQEADSTLTSKPTHGEHSSSQPADFEHYKKFSEFSTNESTNDPTNKTITQHAVMPRDRNVSPGHSTNKLTSRSTDAQPAPNQQPTTNKNEKNEKHEEKNLKGNSATPKPVAGSEEESLLTKSGKRLTGKRLAAFKRLWDAFADKRGKAEAADAWARIPQLTDSLVEIIVEAAQAYAVHARPSILASGGTPKMLQGWITARRWEDDLSTSARSANGLDAIATWAPKEITQ